jgi:putative membrane protein
MKILILNVDRDDDFGRKAGVKSPIIGITENIEAAHKLGENDPEDSDLNAIFSAISTYKSFRNEQKDVEIATICGHINIGIKSDEILTLQLEEVLRKTGTNEVIVVSDGAEDESILPIIQSRAKIISIKRVAVKQSKNIEDTYYRLVKLIDDEKFQKQFMLPLALVLIVWSFFVMLGLAASGLGAILLTLGIYIFIRAFRWERVIGAFFVDIKSGLLTGRLSIQTFIIAVVILIASFFLAYTNTDFTADTEIVPILSFISNMVWGIVVAGLIATFGHVVDTYVRDKKNPWKYWIIFFSLFSFGFIFSAVSAALYKALINWPHQFSIEPFLTFSFIGYSTTGILIAIVGAITYHYIKELYMLEDKEMEIERQTKNLSE